LALPVPLSRFTSRVGGGSAFFVRPLAPQKYMQTKVRPWMLIYTIIFTLLSVSFIRSDITNQYPFIVTTWACICYIVMFVGSLLYSLNRVPSSFRTPWKFVFPILVLQFVFAFIYDLLNGRHPHGVSISREVVFFIIGIVLFFPTFRAHCLIGYGKVKNDDVA
jgi:hypothetical protein